MKISSGGLGSKSAKICTSENIPPYGIYGLRGELDKVSLPELEQKTGGGGVMVIGSIV